MVSACHNQTTIWLLLTFLPLSCVAPLCCCSLCVGHGETSTATASCNNSTNRIKLAVPQLTYIGAPWKLSVCQLKPILWLLQGVRTSHQDFAGRVGDGASTFGGSVWDDNGHGKRTTQQMHSCIPCCRD
eukprot:GHRQ01022553.1.p1 GENE.GHRQ01022553.1~~GHRQ01022553.1.p1  ORF type:complete len:144 (+),score=2.74 GHRQ01022553.1:46-432(+)